MTATTLNAMTLSRRDYTLAFAIGLAVAAFHFFNGLPLVGTVLLQSFNWLFDFDASRFVDGWCVPGTNVAQDLPLSFVARHALTLAVRPFCLGLTSLTGDAQLALMALTATCAGCTAAIAYFLAAQFCEATADRILLSVGFAVTTQPLMLGVIPESYGFALAGIGLHMSLIARNRDFPPRATGIAIAAFVLNAGITITNAVLNVISSAALAWNRVGIRRWVAIEFKTGMAAGVALAIIVVPLAIVFAPTLLAESASAPRQVWWIININRDVPAGLLQVIASLIPYGFVAPEFTLVDLRDDGHAMLDFRAFRYGAPGAVALAMWFVGMLAGIHFAWRHDATRRFLAIVSCWTLVNVILHWYWQYRGSIYLYGAHTSFPLFALVVVGYAGAIREFSPILVRAAAAIMFSLVAYNNIPLYSKMIDFIVVQHPVPQSIGAEKPSR